MPIDRFPTVPWKRGSSCTWASCSRSRLTGGRRSRCSRVRCTRIGACRKVFAITCDRDRRPTWGALAAVLHGVAVADDTTARRSKKIEDQLKAAMEDFQLLDFEDAKQQLEQTLRSISDAGLRQTTVARDAYVDLGSDVELHVSQGAVVAGVDRISEKVKTVPIRGTRRLRRTARRGILRRADDRTSAGRPRAPAEGRRRCRRP